MAHMTKEDATHLHEVLDRAIGIFRDDEMPEKFMKLYEQKKQDFINTFSKEIPSDFWFHGGEFRSLSLEYNSENGFHLRTLIDVEGHLKPVLDQTNRKIKESGIVILEG